MTYDLDTVIEAYAEDKTKRAVTGWIPMADFEAFEDGIRPAMRERGYRVVYRGPRVSNRTYYPTMTRRCDATHAVIY
jgi:hypothetical protein